MSENKKNSIDIKLLDNTFSVKVDNNEDYIRKIEKFVNDELEKIKGNSSHVNRIDIAVLCCMNITEMYFDEQKKLEQERNRILEIEEEKQDLVRRLEDAKKEVERVRDEKKDIIDEGESLRQEITDKNELLNQYREHVKQAKDEIEASRKSILEYQNKLLEMQIELDKSKNFLDKK